MKKEKTLKSLRQPIKERGAEGDERGRNRHTGYGRQRSGRDTSCGQDVLGTVCAELWEGGCNREILMKRREINAFGDEKIVPSKGEFCHVIGTFKEIIWGYIEN